MRVRAVATSVCTCANCKYLPYNHKVAFTHKPVLQGPPSTICFLHYRRMLTYTLGSVLISQISPIGMDDLGFSESLLPYVDGMANEDSPQNSISW